MRSDHNPAGRSGPARQFVLALALIAGLSSQPRVLPAQTGADSVATLRAALAAADRAAGDSAQRQGLARALAAFGSEQLVLVYPGAPVLAGIGPVQAFLATQPDLGDLLVGWTPLHAEVSGDGSFGVTYGVTAIASRGGTGGLLRFGKYLSAWRRTPQGWRLAAHAQLFLVDPARVVIPPGMLAAPRPPLAPGSSSAAFVTADSLFAAMAGKEGAEKAFTAYAAADAVSFSAAGPLNQGPEAIGRSVRDDGAPSMWAWWPVAAGGSGRGDLGFTVGEAEIRSGGGAAGGGVYYGKYLTLWRREPDGAIRFLADGGSARPAPAGR